MEGERQPPPTPEPARREGLPAQLWLEPWRDDLVEASGFGPRSMYVESCWLPVLGPTATWLYRRLGSWAEWHPDGFNLETAELGQALGLGEGLGRSSGLNRAVERLVRFHAVHRDGAQLRIRIALPPLSNGRLHTLTPDLLRLHEESVRRPQPDWERR